MSEQKIKELRTELHRLDVSYYGRSHALVSDSEYDQKYRELLELEAQHPEFADPNSPTQRVGSAPLDGGFKRAAHETPMLSIDDVFEVEEVETFAERLAGGGEFVQLVVEPKIDGMAISLVYEGGKLVRAVTRGDGAEGEDVTANAKTIKSIPLELDTAVFGSKEIPRIEIRGEIYVAICDFDAYNEFLRIQEKPLMANPRNMASGSMKSLDSRETAKRPLSFVAHGLIMDRDVLPMLGEDMAMTMLTQNLGFPILASKFMCFDMEGVKEALSDVSRNRAHSGIPTDGAVIKVSDLDRREEEGCTSRAPRWACAFKFPPEQAPTVLRAITLQVGKTGNITPVAELNPVLIDGSTVSRATLHNQNEIERKDIRLGDTVLVEKAGDIIPAVVSVVMDKRKPDSKPYDLQRDSGGLCPSCGNRLQRPEGQAAWKCMATETCPAQLQARFMSAAGRDALELEGLGPEFIECFYDAGITHFLLLYMKTPEDVAEIELKSPKKRANQEADSKPVFGKARAYKLYAALERAKHMPLHRWIYAMGIEGVGRSASKELSRLHRNFTELCESDIIPALAELKGAKKDDPILAPLQIDQSLGPAAASAFFQFFNRSLTGAALKLRMKDYRLDPQSDNYDPTPTKPEGGLSGKTFVITGTLSKPRKHFQKLIEESGGKVSGSVTKSTDYLLCGEGGGSKRDKAAKLDIPVVDEDEFVQLLG